MQRYEKKADYTRNFMSTLPINKGKIIDEMYFNDDDIRQS